MEQALHSLDFGPRGGIPKRKWGVINLSRMGELTCKGGRKDFWRTLRYARVGSFWTWKGTGVEGGNRWGRLLQGPPLRSDARREPKKTTRSPPRELPPEQNECTFKLGRVPKGTFWKKIRELFPWRYRTVVGREIWSGNEERQL